MKNYELLIALLLAGLVTGLIGIKMIPFLRKLKCGQEIREEGPSWHKKKEGTPTMGGIMIVIGYLTAIVLAITVSIFNGGFLNGELKNFYKLNLFLSGNVLALGMGAVGFIDDYIKVIKKRNLGLTARQKTILQLVVSVSYLVCLGFGGLSTTYIPFVGDVIITKGFGILFWPIALVFIYGFVNAVNLTDGLDGLASSVTLIASCGLMLLSSSTSKTLNAVQAAALIGACFGFLIWNGHPAKVFMGDTGSLYLGGMVVAIAFSTGRPIYLLAFGIVYLCEALSVVLQVFSFKLFKKRIFKMSPIHHHFELCGWNEDKIVFIFSFVTLLFSALVVVPNIIK